MSLRWPLPTAYPITNDSDAHLARGSGEACDFAAPPGVPWLACADAVVKVNQHDVDAGWMVWIQWLDAPTDVLYRARYAHGDHPGPMAVGTEVSHGDIIGWVGDTATGQTGAKTTGPHLHFALERWTGAGWQRVRPEDYLSHETPESLPIDTPSAEAPMKSIKDSLDRAWALLSVLQTHPEATPEIVALAEQVKQEVVVEIKIAVGLQ